MTTRRFFLERAGAATALAMTGQGCVTGGKPPFVTPLPIPALQEARKRNGHIDIIATKGKHAFFPNQQAATYGFSAAFLGPVLMLHSGDEVQFSVENKLDEVTTAHWHGVLAPAAVDGGPHLAIKPGEIWRPRFRVNQLEATAWYHAHPHGDSGRQVYMGLAGMVIIKDGTSQRLGLPESYGVDDLPIILQDRTFDSTGNLKYAVNGPAMMMGVRGDTLIVNGAIAPVARVPAGIVRLRILNAANARNFDLSFQDDRAFHVIASDGGYLPNPVAMTTLTIAPGERFEVLVDLSDGQAVELVTAEDRRALMGMGSGIGTAMTNEMSGSGAGSLMRFEVDGSLAAPVKSIPLSLLALQEPTYPDSIVRRQISLDMGPGMMRGMRMGGGGMGSGPPVGINGRVFDMNRIDFEPALGSSEIWEISPTMMAHPFHIHGVIFRILSMSGKPPAAHLAGGKDTVLLDGPAELLMRFLQPASREAPFMFHCHILEHEDRGMMGQYATR